MNSLDAEGGIPMKNTTGSVASLTHAAPRFRKPAALAAVLAAAAILCFGSAARVAADGPADSAASGPASLIAVSASTLAAEDGAWYTPPAPVLSPSAASTTPPAANGDNSSRSDVFTQNGPNNGRATASLATSASGAPAGTQVTASASCLDGEELRGGNGLVLTSDGRNVGNAILSQSRPSSATTWTVVGFVGGAQLAPDETLQVTAVALCA